MTVLGINAGFGEPIAGEFPFFERIGVAAVRQDLFAHGETAPIEALVAEFSNRPMRALFMLAGGKMQAADGANRIEPHVLAARARRVVEAAQAVGLQQYSLEVGNEPDIAHDGYASRPQDFAEAIRQVHAVVRPLGFEGDLISGGVSNLNERGLEYLQSMLSAPAVPADVVIGNSRRRQHRLQILQPALIQVGDTAADEVTLEPKRSDDGMDLPDRFGKI